MFSLWTLGSAHNTVNNQASSARAMSMALTKHNRNLTQRGTYAVLRWCFNQMQAQGTGPILPLELLDNICSILHPQPLRQVTRQSRLLGPHPASTPPADGSQPLFKLPVELRRQIFAGWLPFKDNTIPAGCCANDETPLDPVRKPKRNRVSDLMTLNKQIKDEIAVAVYEEYKYQIHVHQGINAGGIEFLDAGRQPLHYQASSSDDRFQRFGDGQEFGFNRLKKVEIIIFPSTADGRHGALSAYYMNLSLVRLLERSGEENRRIVSITIKFEQPTASAHDQTNRRAIMRGEHHYYDPDAQAPRCTSVHGLSDVELMLWPFAHFNKVHNVDIKLPPELRSHAASIQFASDLAKSMTSTDAPIMQASDQLSLQIEMARQSFEDYIFNSKYGSNQIEAEKITEDEFMKDDLQGTPKHSREVEDDGGRRKRSKTTEDVVDLTEDDDDDDVKMQEAIFKSLEMDSGDGSWGSRLGMSSSSSAEATGLLSSLAAERQERRGRYRPLLSSFTRTLGGIVSGNTVSARPTHHLTNTRSINRIIGDDEYDDDMRVVSGPSRAYESSGRSLWDDGSSISSGDTARARYPHMPIGTAGPPSRFSSPSSTLGNPVADTLSPYRPGIPRGEPGAVKRISFDIQGLQLRNEAKSKGKAPQKANATNCPFQEEEDDDEEL